MRVFGLTINEANAWLKREPDFSHPTKGNIRTNPTKRYQNHIKPSRHKRFLLTAKSFLIKEEEKAKE